MRQYIYGFLCLVAIAWTVFWIVNINTARQETLAESTSAGGRAGASIGSSLASTCTVVPGLGAIAVFGLLTHRSRKQAKLRRIVGEKPPETPLDPSV